MRLPSPSPRVRKLLRVLGGTFLAGVAVFGIVCVLGWFFWVLPWWRPIRDEAAITSQAHWDLTVDHPGWSFPARIWSDSAALDLPPARIAAEARARAYAEGCPPAGPGQF
nr:hypothetical protein [Deltaproteobacteria bacterium]